MVQQRKALYDMKLWLSEEVGLISYDYAQKWLSQVIGMVFTVVILVNHHI